jgi:hypothetical protein
LISPSSSNARFLSFGCFPFAISDSGEETPLQQSLTLLTISRRTRILEKIAERPMRPPMARQTSTSFSCVGLRTPFSLRIIVVWKSTARERFRRRLRVRFPPEHPNEGAHLEEKHEVEDEGERELQPEDERQGLQKQIGLEDSDVGFSVLRLCAFLTVFSVGDRSLDSPPEDQGDH